MKYLKTSLIILLYILSTNSYSQLSTTEIDKLVNEAMETFNVPGCAVGIVKDGKVVHSKGYGLKSVETNEIVNEHTNFSIASNSKAFTAVALAILVDEKKLSWDDKVIDIIPEFRMYDEYVTNNFNIVDLITHRSGLGNEAGDLLWWPGGTDFKMKEILTCFQFFEPVSAFRTKFSYNNILYIIAGEIISRVSGMTWDEFVHTMIFERLEMGNSFSSLTQTVTNKNFATAHLEMDGILEIIPHLESDFIGPAGGIYSNVDDLNKWMLALLNRDINGENLENQLLSESNHKKMWRIHTVLNSDFYDRWDTQFIGYGLGWDVINVSGKMIVSHGGTVPGMRSLPVLVPDLNFGIFVLTNSNRGNYLHLAVTNTVVNKYLELEEKNWIEHYSNKLTKNVAWIDSATSRFWVSVNAAKTDDFKIDDYIGIYEDKWFGKVEIFNNDSQLWFKCYKSPKLTGPLYYYEQNTFAIKWKYPDVSVNFDINSDGKVIGFKIKGIHSSSDLENLNLLKIN